MVCACPRVEPWSVQGRFKTSWQSLRPRLVKVVREVCPSSWNTSVTPMRAAISMFLGPSATRLSTSPSLGVRADSTGGHDYH